MEKTTFDIMKSLELFLCNTSAAISAGSLRFLYYGRNPTDEELRSLPPAALNSYIRHLEGKKRHYLLRIKNRSRHFDRAKKLPESTETPKPKASHPIVRSLRRFLYHLTQ